MKLILSFFLLSIFSFAEFNMEISNVTECKLNSEKLIYRIIAEKKIVNNQNIKKDLLMFSKEEMVAKNIFYTNGIFETKDIKIIFKKAYFLESNFVMIDATGNYKNINFESKKVIFKYNKLEFEDSFIKLEEKQFKKLKYTLNIDN